MDKSWSLLFDVRDYCDHKYDDKQKTIKIRDEVQVYPNKPLRDALMNKLLADGNKIFL